MKSSCCSIEEVNASSWVSSLGRFLLRPDQVEHGRGIISLSLPGCLLEGERDNGKAHLEKRLPRERRVAHGLAMSQCAAEFLQANWLSRFAQRAVSR